MKGFLSEKQQFFRGLEPVSRHWSKFRYLHWNRSLEQSLRMSGKHAHERHQWPQCLSQSEWACLDNGPLVQRSCFDTFGFRLARILDGSRIIVELCDSFCKSFIREKMLHINHKSSGFLLPLGFYGVGSQRLVRFPCVS